MKLFNETFLLRSNASREIYEKIKHMPICDYHCHLDATELADNIKFENITKLWLSHDHYKWRMMRWYGVEEKYITGHASDYEKFVKWAEVLEHSIGNPIYTWSHMELKQYFDIHEPLTKDNAALIWEVINKKLKAMSARDFVKLSNVKYICTTDDPCDSLSAHKKLSLTDFDTKVTPTFRPDKIIQIGEETRAYFNQLSDVTGIQIDSLDRLLEAIEDRFKYFMSVGCKISDHSIENPEYIQTTYEEAVAIFDRLDQTISPLDQVKWASFIQVVLGKMYHQYDCTMQLHIGAMRNNNDVLFNQLGKDSGLDALSDDVYINDLSRLLSDLGSELPRTILYPLNPKDNTALSVLAGCFQHTKGHVQLGAAWWFNDHKPGMRNQIEILASTGMISEAVGMLTDSRSLLSYTRHDYYRRILCNYFGELIEDGELVFNEKLIEIVKNISFYNAERFLKLGGNYEYKG